MTGFLLSVVLSVAAPVPKEVDERFEKGVSAAREKAIEFLRKQQNPEGNWEGIVIGFLADMHGGSTGLVVLAMLEAGVPPNDAGLTKAIDFVAKLPPKMVYVVSLQLQVLAKVDAKKYAADIQKLADWLVENSVKANGKFEGWSYPMNQIADASNTHFAVVALHVAAQTGAKVDAKIWGQLRDLYVRTQLKDGQWPYYAPVDGKPLDIGSVNMTGSALLGLAIVAKYDKDAKHPVAAFEKGMADYVTRGFESPKSTTYNWMLTAELGRTMGVSEFKSGDKVRAWYRVGAAKLMKDQQENGSWGFGRQVDRTLHIATAFGLYFLGPPVVKK